MTFPDFQIEWCQSYFTKMSLKLIYIENMGTILPMVT